MEFFTDTVMRDLLASSLETAELGADGFADVGTGPGSAEAQYVDWLTIADNEQSVGRRCGLHSATTRWSLQTSPSTATSTTWPPAALNEVPQEATKVRFAQLGVTHRPRRP